MTPNQIRGPLEDPGSEDVVALLAAERAAAARLALLQEITAALAAVGTRDEVGRAVLQRTLAGLQGAIGNLALLTRDGGEFEVLGTVNGRLDVVDAWRRFPASLDTPSAAAVRSEEEVSAWRLATMRDRFPIVAPTLEALGVGAVWCVRLASAERVLGTMDLCFSTPRLPSREDVSLLAAVAGQCVVALERAEFAEAERRARERAERLQRLTEALSEACTVEEVADAAVVHASAAFAAVGTVIALIKPDGETLELVKASHMTDDTFETWRRFPLTTATPLADVARTGEPRLLGSRAEWEREYPDLLPLLVEQGQHATAVVPLVVNRQTVGAVGMAFDTPRTFVEEDLALMQSAARQCALALERARLFEAERMARAEAEAASRAKSEFLAVMSHELRTPLNAIGGYAELLELGIRGPVTAEQLLDLHRIQTAQRHLTGLVTDVLNYVRIETGHVQYAIEEVDVAEVLAGLEAMVMPQLAAKQLRYHQEPFDAKLRVRADAEKVQQVLVNLLTNAQKFTPPGGRITLAVAAGRHETSIVVRDTGEGIAADKLQSIFEPFVQVDKRLTRTNEGVGLGLAISRDLARGMGGDLVAESTPGEGSVFTLTLPTA